MIRNNIFRVDTKPIDRHGLVRMALSLNLKMMFYWKYSMKKMEELRGTSIVPKV